jgi:RNA polymerase sigma factor (sigma-70 family)
VVAGRTPRAKPTFESRAKPTFESRAEPTFESRAEPTFESGVKSALERRAKPAFESVVARHGPMVLRVVRAVVGPADADDAWSETFLAALKAYPGLPDDANVEAWLVTIAHRKAVDVVRAEMRRATPVADVPDVATSPPADQRDLDLAAQVAALPTKQRLAVAYHYLAGLPYAQIASLLGGAESAARRAAADGIAALRNTLRKGASR